MVLTFESWNDWLTRISTDSATAMIGTVYPTLSSLSVDASGYWPPLKEPESRAVVRQREGMARARREWRLMFWTMPVMRLVRFVVVKTMGRVRRMGAGLMAWLAWERKREELAAV